MEGIIIVTLLAALAAALFAKHTSSGRRRRPMGKYLRGNVNENLDLSTLGAKVAIEASFDEVVNERTLVSSIVARWSMNNFTPAATAGPILVGVAHSAYSATLIEEWIETTGSWNETDLPEQEIAQRKIRRVGIFDTPDAASDSAVLNDGKAIKTKLNWILNQSQTLVVWAYNLGNAALATTSPQVQVEGHANLWPR